MEQRLRYGELVLHAGIRIDGDKLQLVTESGRHRFVWEALAPGEYLLRDGAVQRRCIVARRGKDRWVWVDGRAHHLQVETGAARAEEHDAGGHEAPMPGQVLKVLVAPGQQVQRHQPLVLLEAMKMQIEITASRAGRVGAVRAREGEQVAAGAVLVVLEAEAAP
jgi:3-methylcrotonyl-CoA carboxylase alpha subunit